MQLSTARPDVSYYAPRARVEVQGKELGPEVAADLISTSVTLEVDQLASFSLTVNNWNATTLSFSYSNTGLFDVGHTVHLQLGYADRMVSVMRGAITSISPAFPESGPPTITINGQDSLVLLRQRDAKGSDQRKFTNMSDGEIAEVIARRNGLVPKVDKRSENHPVVFQRDLDDLKFLLERAKCVDYDCYIVNDPASGKDELHFENPSDGRDAQRTRVYDLRWGRDLIQFDPTITIARQVAAVTVRGWDPQTKSVIEGHADLNDVPGKTDKGTTGPALAKDRLRDKTDVVVDRPVQSKQEADNVARSILRSRANEFFTGTGRCIGQPEMRPGDNIRLSGLGQRYDGTYYVTKTVHTFNASGYLTEFSVRRDFDGGVEKA